jgi:hypothetical protein
MSTPHWKIVAIEETRDWDSKALHAWKTGRMWGIYLFDANRQLHCCEITPSYELHFIETITEKLITEQVYDAIMLADRACDDVKYVHCRSIDALSADHFNDLGLEDVRDDDYDEALEAQLEYCRGNQHCPAITFKKA